MLSLIVNAFVSCIALANEPVPSLEQPQLGPGNSSELMTDEGSIESHQAIVDDQSRYLVERVKSSEWLMKMGITDGIQAVLPIIVRLYQENTSFQEEQKIVNKYLETVDPGNVKKQVLRLITSGNEHIENREAGVTLATLMKDYFTDDEIRALIDNEDNPRMKGALIVWLDYVGDASDYPAPEDVIFQNDERAIQASIELRQEEVDNPLGHMESRVKDSEWLMERGVTDGLQAVLPVIDKLARVRSLKEKQKMVDDYLETVDPEIVKTQVLRLIASDQERNGTRLGAIGLAKYMSKYFNSDEVKVLIVKESDPEIKSGLISLLGYVGDISDFPYLMKIADISLEKYGEVEERAVNTLSFMASTQHWPGDPPFRHIHADDPPRYIKIVLHQWKQWWKKTAATEQEGIE